MKDKGHTHSQALVERTKEIITELLALPERPRENYSIFISDAIRLNYTYIANIFSETCGITIEHFIIEKKIEKAIGLLNTGRYSVSEVTRMLSYSSIGHFSNQFKKVTGQRPTAFIKTHRSNIAETGNTQGH